jgi:hypothetical protein
MRAKSENGEAGVAFQSPQETFTQWREEEQEVRKVESPQPAPSSFAEALLRKLNINDGTDGNDSTGKVANLHVWYCDLIINKVRQSPGLWPGRQTRSHLGNIRACHSFRVKEYLQHLKPT